MRSLLREMLIYESGCLVTDQFTLMNQSAADALNNIIINISSQSCNLVLGKAVDGWIDGWVDGYLNIPYET